MLRPVPNREAHFRSLATIRIRLSYSSCPGSLHPVRIVDYCMVAALAFWTCQTALVNYVIRLMVQAISRLFRRPRYAGRGDTILVPSANLL